MITHIPYNKTPRSKRREWSIYVVIEAEMYQGRVLSRKKNTKKLRDMSNKPVSCMRDYLYLGVTRMYKRNGILYIITGSGKKKEIHRHEVKRVCGLFKREYKREGVQ